MRADSIGESALIGERKRCEDLMCPDRPFPGCGDVRPVGIGIYVQFPRGEVAVD
jgi:hypothetical protein